MTRTSLGASRSPFSGLGSQLWVYAGMAIPVVALTGIAESFYPGLFDRFAGGVSPSALVAGISVVGAALASLLAIRGPFEILRRGDREGLIRAVALASLFGVAIVVADLVIVHPADMNVPFPASLLFYPVIGFMAEIVFHLFPLTILWVGLSAIAGEGRRRAVLWGSVVATSLIEPSLQILAVVTEAPLIGEAQPYSGWALVNDGLHIFAINVVELYIFRRHDFVSMYVFRLTYYLVWHIAWGQVRLGVLF